MNATANTGYPLRGPELMCCVATELQRAYVEPNCMNFLMVMGPTQRQVFLNYLLTHFLLMTYLEAELMCSLAALQVGYQIPKKTGGVFLGAVVI